MKKLWILILSMFALGVLLPQALYAAVNMQEGEWEITTEVVVEGMPFSMPPMKTKHCLTKEDLVPKSSEKGKESNCKIINQKITGNTVTWKAVCVDKDTKSESEGEITYSGSSYKGAMLTKTTDKSGNIMNAKMKLAGRRIGDCSKSTKSETDGMIAKAKEQAAEAEKAGKAAESKQVSERSKYLDTVKEGHSFKPHATEAGACILKDFTLAASPECGQKLDVNSGKWEITRDEVVEMLGVKPPYDISGSKDKYEQCLSAENPAPDKLTTTCVQDIKRSGNRITWKVKCPSQQGISREGDGELVYSGNSFKAITVVKNKNNGTPLSNEIIKLTGRRTGECAGRDYTSQKRDYTSQPRESEKKKEEKTNPVKSIRKIFGF